jgi:hypothetical protein
MALEDNIVFAHFCDTLTEDFPTAAGTKSNPSGRTDPGVSAGELTFNNSQAITFTYGSNIWSPGTGDFTVAVKATINQYAFNDNVLIHIGTSTAFENALLVRAVGNIYDLAVTDQSASPLVKTGAGFYSVGSPFTIVVVRESGTLTIYDGSGVADNTNTTEFNGHALAAASSITLGSEHDGTVTLDGLIDFAVVWDRALTSAELQNNINETDLKAALSGGGGDTTAPTLTSPTGTQSGQTTADLSVSTDEDNGTLYWVVSESDTPPSVAQIQAGNDSTGSAATDSGSQSVSATGTQNANATGLSPGTTYYAYFQHTDAASNDSTVAASSSFTTAAAAGTLTFTEELSNNTGTDQTSLTGLTATVIDLATRDAVLVLTGQTTNVSGVPEAITDALIEVGSDYRVVWMSADGTAAGMSEPVTAT